MNPRLSDDETRAKHIGAMGEDLGKPYSLLSNDLTWLFVVWKQYVDLFSKPSRLDLLNDSAPFFFGLLQRVFWHDMLLGIARITDPAQTAGKPNLTIRRLPSLLPSAELRLHVEALLLTALGECAFAADWRNRRIAHRDLHLLTDPAASPLAPATKGTMDAALDSIAAVLHAIESHYHQSTTAYKMTVTSFDSNELLFTLRDGLLLRVIREEKLEKGEYDPREWHDSEPQI